MQANRTRTTVARYIADALQRAGVSHVFGVPGGPMLSLYDALADFPTITTILAKHEEGAAFMAEGFAQATGRLGVVCATSGPGALHALTGVASATADGVPVLAITAQVDTALFGRGALQDSSGGSWSIDTVSAYLSATKLSVVATSAQQIPRLLALAVRTAYDRRRGGVHLSIPADVLGHSVHGDVPLLGEPARPTNPDRLALGPLAALVAAARHGVIFAGQGAKLANAGPELVRLAECLSWPVVTTLKGKSVFPEDHRLSAGVFGFGGSDRAHRITLNPCVDMLLVVGSSLGELSTHGWDPALVNGRTIGRIDIDPLRADAGFTANATVAADAAVALRALRQLCPPRRAALPLPPAHPAAQSNEEKLQASAVIASLSDLLPPDSLIFADNGNCLSWLGEHFVSRGPGKIYVSLNLGAMGYSAGAAIGASIALKNRTVVALVGDAAFAMGGMEIHTAAELGLPVIWLVLNNSGNGMVYNVQHGLFGRSTAAMYRRPLNAAAIARGLGAGSAVVTSVEQFAEALREALVTPGPYLIDVQVDPDEVPWALSGRISTLRAAFVRTPSPDGQLVS